MLAKNSNMCENKLHDSSGKYKDSGFSKEEIKMLVKTGDFIFKCCSCESIIDYFEFNGRKSIYFWVDDNLKVNYTRCSQCSNEYQKQYRESSELRKLKHGIRSCIGNSMKKKGYTKNTNTYKYLKISNERFKENIDNMALLLKGSNDQVYSKIEQLLIRNKELEKELSTSKQKVF